MSAALRVVHVSFHRDVQRRAPDRLLAEWPALTRIAGAAASPECHVEVVQACEHDGCVEVDGIPVHFVKQTSIVDALSIRLGSKLSAAEGVLNRSAELDPHVAHVHGLGYPLQLLRLRMRLPHAAIVVQDHAGEPSRGWRKALHRRALAGADAVLFTAFEQAAPFFAEGLLRSGLPVFEVLEDSSLFAPADQQDARRRSGIGGDPCLLWLGRLAAVKDPLGVLDAVALASSSLPGIRLWCCYRDAPLKREVQERIASDSRLRDRVVLLGPRPHDEVETLCQAADFLIQGSLREGSGYAVIEALACGTTPLVTDIPALRSITEQGRFGALAAPGDAAGMAENLIEWAGKDRARLRQEARRHFENTLSYAAIGRDLRAIYEAVARRR